MYILQSDVGTLPGRLRGVWRGSKGLKTHAVPSGGTVTLCRIDIVSDAWSGPEWLPLPGEVTCRPCAASLKALRDDPRRPLGIQPPADPGRPASAPAPDAAGNSQRVLSARVTELEKALAEAERSLAAERDRVSVCAFWRQVAGFIIAQEPEGSVALPLADLVAALRVRVTAAFEDDGSLSVSASYPRFTDKFRESLVAFTRGAAREVREEGSA